MSPEAKIMIRTLRVKHFAGYRYPEVLRYKTVSLRHSSTNV